GERRYRFPHHEALTLEAISDQLRDVDQFQIMLASELSQFWNARHGSILVEDFADHSDRCQPCHARQIDCSLGMPGALQDAARTRHQGRYVPGPAQITWPAHGIGDDSDCGGTVVSADSGRDTKFSVSIDRDRECCSLRVVVLLNHERQIKTVR